MARAYLKIWAENGREGDVREKLLGIPEVKAADLTAGEQDLIVVVEADTYEDLLQTVLGRIRPMKGIQRTVTNLVV